MIKAVFDEEGEREKNEEDQKSFSKDTPHNSPDFAWPTSLLLTTTTVQQYGTILVSLDGKAVFPRRERDC